MRFDIYGRFQVEVLREGDSWIVYRVGEGKRRQLTEVVIPPTEKSGAIAKYLDDLFHELATPGKTVRRVH
jgi:hypothetical protein